MFVHPSAPSPWWIYPDTVRSVRLCGPSKWKLPKYRYVVNLGEKDSAGVGILFMSVPHLQMDEFEIRGLRQPMIRSLPNFRRVRLALGATKGLVRSFQSSSRKKEEAREEVLGD